ncbi:stress response translation initiation inhibitor YciH [Simiduia sp. 21SJ11W-1]|uniref:stress response translation initiation inhibitor YciH n=1 Tax=Simiduia sp. 21SJ11W-1 TaxID=2909669 RepID=UPI0020A0D0A8|nr:stress response translation initiation inhibitor YciH [Simiduia sp. 21SJ11W-1]UTA49075.1 stress response translation initiation inhibitor YciH [Simiduia sp. 21SJ11W-1]
MSKNSRLVYSTETGRVDEKAPSLTPPAGDGIVRITRSSKGRGGKSVSVVTGLGLGKDELKTLAKALKQVCGVGGSVKDWDIEIQGDMREKLKAELEKRGFTVKLAGG